MPEPRNPVEQLPANFDPEYNCGAKLRGKDTVCMRRSGHGTDHVGVGRCNLHGGISTTIKHGRYSLVARDTILQRAEQLKNDPELLSLDQQLAVLKAVFERYMEHYNLQIEDYESFLERLQEADDEDDTARLIQETFPVMDLSIVKEIANVAYKSFDMHYSKRYSVPIEEMAEMLNGIIGAFTTVAEKYGLPNEARAEFAAEVRAIRSQKMVATTAGNGKKQLILDGGRD